MKEEDLFKDVESNFAQSSPDDSPQGSTTGSEDNTISQPVNSDGPLFSSIHLGNYREVVANQGGSSTGDRPPSPTIFLSLRVSTNSSQRQAEGSQGEAAREGTNVTFNLSDQGLESVPRDADEESEGGGEGDREDNASSSGDEAQPSASGSQPTTGRSETIRIADSVTFILRSGTAAAESAERVLLSLGQRSLQRQGSDRRFTSNTPRLSHYIQESNQGKGYIKEIAFNKDGTLLCSPFGFGIRLLAFDPLCRELCDCVPDSPVELHEVTSVITHRNVVLTSKFSPSQSLLVTGCKDGKIDFHQPRF